MEPLEDRTVPSNYAAANVAELIAAINAANITPEADTIELAAGTTFTLTEAISTTSGPTGLPTIAADGGDLAIVGNGSVIERGTTAGTPVFRLFHVASEASLTLDDLTLQRGLVTGTTARGGAIHNQGELNLNGVIVQNNTASGGTQFGGFGPTRGFSAVGGGIYSTGTLNLADCTIQNNRAVGGNGRSTGSAFGGGLCVLVGTADLRNVNLVGNTAQGGNALASGRPSGRTNSVGPGGSALGGGLYVSAGSVDLVDVEMVSNTARGGNGGASRVAAGSGSNGGHGLGGGVYVEEGEVTLHHCIVTDNSAIGGNGGSGRPAGSRGKGIGGGLNISPDAQVTLDAFTKSHVKKNEASTSGRNIAGPYRLCGGG